MVATRDIKRAPVRDGGFSLTELMVVLGIMGVVLAGAYSLALVTNRSASTTEIQSAFAQEVGVPLQLAEKYLQQNTGLEEWQDYELVCFTDTDIDGFDERVTIQAHADGRLTVDVWNTDIQHQNTTQRVSFVASENNANVANGTPLFTYLADDSTEVTSTEARASNTRSVIMTVVAEIDGKTLEDDRWVLFRNRPR
jgi:prepilin-type N-terminal cleavage/methylation domain-containing protein